MFVGVGLLCADRLRRDRRTHVEELLRAAQAPLLARLLGKLLGASLATLVPMALIYFGGVVYIAMRWGDFGVLPLAAAAFALLAVPPVLFVVAYCIASTTVLWQPLFMFLYVGFWFWANLGSDVAIPTVNGTYLAPGENYVVSGSFAQSVPFAHVQTTVSWATACNFILTLGAGLLLADRYRRERATRTIELLRAAPAAASARLLGKYLGAVCATLVPILIIYLTGVARLVILWRDVTILPLAAGAFLALVVPPVFFVDAFSLACTTVLWQPLYTFLFVGYWVWTSLNPTGLAIPTLTSTLLSPGEQLVGTGYFGLTPPYLQDVGFYPASSVWLRALNIVVLLACAACALLSGLLIH